jgi:hypothetical protein
MFESLFACLVGFVVGLKVQKYDIWKETKEKIKTWFKSLFTKKTEE